MFKLENNYGNSNSSLKQGYGIANMGNVQNNMSGIQSMGGLRGIGGINIDNNMSNNYKMATNSINNPWSFN